jgi:ribosomal protein L13
MEEEKVMDAHYIKHFRQADSIFQFDIEKHMPLTSKEKHMLKQLKKYESI